MTYVRLEFELTAMVFTVCFRQGYDRLRLSLTLFTDALRKILIKKEYIFDTERVVNRHISKID